MPAAHCGLLASCIHSHLVGRLLQVLLDSITGQQQQQQAPGSSGGSHHPSVLQQLPLWLSSGRQDLERALARVAAGTAAPAEAVKLWTRLAEVGGGAPSLGPGCSLLFGLFAFALC